MNSKYSTVNSTESNKYNIFMYLYMYSFLIDLSPSLDRATIERNKQKDK